MSITIADVMRPGLGQAAFSAYVDAAQAEGNPHDRLTAGSYAAARAVIAALIESGDIRPTIGPAVHGTSSGYTAGCHCEYCTEAMRLVARARYHYNDEQGHNKVNGQRPG